MFQKCTQGWGGAHRAECLASMQDALGLTPALHGEGTTAHNSSRSTQEVETGRAEVQDHLLRHSKFKDKLARKPVEGGRMERRGERGGGRVCIYNDAV